MKAQIVLFIFFLALLSQSVSKKASITREEVEELLKLKEFQEIPEDEDSINLNALFSGNECLPSKNDAVQILKEMGINESNPDDNLRFIVGKCNPIILVPGLYFTKLRVQVNCRGLSTFEKETTFRDLRIACGDTVCGDESKEFEEHSLFISLSDNAMSILGIGKDKYSTCLAFFMNYFQNEKECPNLNGKPLCNYSKYIQVGFYGSTLETMSKGKCGLEAMQNIMQSGQGWIDNVINSGPSKAYLTMIQALTKRGYKEGFSLGGLPNDYRRYLATNNFSTKVFRSQVERLYANTGKPVVIVAHSFGTLLILTNLVKKENEDLLPKIKKFISIGPPFAGAGELLDAFFHGVEYFSQSVEILGKKIEITNYNTFGQLVMYKTLPPTMELRPSTGATDVFTNSTYKDLSEALRERIAIENECRNKECSSDDISKNSAKFDAIFKGFFPSLTENECAYESTVGGNLDTFYRKCYTEIYDVANCPTVVVNSSSFNPDINDVESFCGEKDEKFYYQGRCDNSEGKQCLDDIYTTQSPYAYQNAEAVSFLMDRFNKNFASKFDKGEIDESYFDSLEDIRDGFKKILSYQKEISLIKDLPAPQVDTDIIYATFEKTATAYKYEENNFAQKGDICYRGGDGTVATWSALLTGLKWIYDKQTNPEKYPKKYKLVEYCSRLSKSDKYKLNPEKEQEFIALGCGCLNNDGTYKSDVGACSHAAMITDESDGSVIKYVISVADDPKEEISISDGKREAAENYDRTKNYESECNADLYDILQTAK